MEAWLNGDMDRVRDAHTGTDLYARVAVEHQKLVEERRLKEEAAAERAAEEVAVPTAVVVIGEIDEKKPALGGLRLVPKL
jgi:hypothetical protein